ncbi:zinc ribbon domain-containing protein [Bacillus salipaludis]|uniref:zinc ribbon domain-containing protein n=1 Tax=Bacillus salipaludis TaxID=2547811 RepID=UPI003D1BDBBE
MYCKTCGAENHPSANYCINDGVLLRNNQVKYRKKEGNSAFCSSCGEKTSSSMNYCQNCGENLIQFEQEKGIIPKITMEKNREVRARQINLPSFHLGNVTKVIIPTLVAIIIMLALSFSMMKSTEKVFTSLLNDEMPGYDFYKMIDEIGSSSDIDLPKPGKLIGVTDILMLSNLQNPEVTFHGSGEVDLFGKDASMDIQAKNGFMLYLFLPFIGLFIAGIMAGRKTRGISLSNRLSDALGIAILYAVFCTIVSLFAGFSYDVKVLGLSLEINTHYSFIKTLLMTFLFGFIFSSLGILFSTNFRKITGQLSEMVPFGEAIHQAIAVPIRGIFILFVLWFIFITSKISELKEQLGYELEGTPLEAFLNKSYGLICSLSLQLGTYMWNLLHFSSLTFKGHEGSDGGSFAYHILSGIKSGGDVTDSDTQMIQEFITSSDIGLYLKIGLVLPIILLIWAGFRMSQKEDLIKNLAVFSGVYAVIMMGIAAFSDVGFSFAAKDDPETMSMMLGFSPISTLIGSFIFSFIFAYIGSWIAKLRVE